MSVSALGLKVTAQYAAVLDERDTGTADAFEEIFAGSLLVAEFLTRLRTWWSPNDGWLFKCAPETARMFRLTSGDMVLVDEARDGGHVPARSAGAVRVRGARSCDCRTMTGSCPRSSPAGCCD